MLESLRFCVLSWHLLDTRTSNTQRVRTENTRIQSPGFRGYAFLNAVAEYPDPGHAVHRAAPAHRQWFLETVTELLAQAGHAPADAAGRHFVMLRDGAMAAGCLFDPQLVTETFLEGVEGILRTRAA